MNNHCKTTKVYLALGSNLGDRRANLVAALNRLRFGGRLRLTSVSGLYETTPVGYADQPDFLNMVVEAQTELEPLALLAAVKQVEADLGRQPTFRNGPRPIDIDLIFYGREVFESTTLQIPHPRMRGRGFVLAPLAELAPEYFHPGYGRTVSELLKEIDLKEQGVLTYTAEPPLAVTLPRYLFVTGHLAVPLLQEYLNDYAARVGFEFEIAALNIDVAAFINVRYLCDHLQLTPEQQSRLDMIILPGFAQGEPERLEALTGVKVALGPTELAELEPWLERLTGRCFSSCAPVSPYYTEQQLRTIHSRLTDNNIRIFTDGEKIYAFNNQIFAMGGTSDRDLRNIFKQLQVENGPHAFYLGKELYKAAVCLRLGKVYHQDREPDW